MSNSALVSCIMLSPNHSGKRTHAIDTITIHCMAGNLSVESCGAIFARSSRQASSNYGVGSDGRVGLYVDEENRSWCSASAANDQRAITIEVANNGGAPDWPISDEAYKALVELCTDICKRNGIKWLNYTGDTSGNMTLHRWFQATACPGDYLVERMSRIADAVNKKLEDENMNYYKNLKDVPENYRPTIRKLMERGVMKGYSDPDPNSLEDNIINVSEDFCRTMTVLDRLGKLD